MVTRTQRTAAAVAVGAVAVTVPGAASAQTADEPQEQHCVLHIIGQEPGGRFITDEPVCYPTLAEALADAGVPLSHAALRGGVSGAEADAAVQAASGTLGVHYDGANRTGSSITVSGGDCNGGYVNLTSAWTNRISSTLNSCEAVNFWDGFDKTGGYEPTTTGTNNLSSMNNQANSIGYA